MPHVGRCRTRPTNTAARVGRPTLTRPRQIPLDGESGDVVEIAQSYADWLSTSDVPKLCIDADEGTILAGAQREFARGWPNQTRTTAPACDWQQIDRSVQVLERLLPVPWGDVIRAVGLMLWATSDRSPCRLVATRRASGCDFPIALATCAMCVRFDVTTASLRRIAPSASSRRFERSALQPDVPASR